MWYDFIVLAILGFATFRGAAKGIVWQLAAIGALLLCFAFAETLSLALAPAISVEPPLNRWIAMFLIYIGFSFVAFGAARWLRDWIEKARFVEFDRHLGGLFGLLKGALFALVLTFFAVTLSETAREHVMHSYSGHAAAIVMDRLHPVMPAELHDVLEPYIHQLDRPGIDLHHSPHAPHGHAGDHSHGHPHDHGHSPSPPPFPGGSADVQTPPASSQPVPPQPGPPQPGPADDSAAIVGGIAAALDAIIDIYSDHPHAQAAFFAEVEDLLSGLPDPVVLGVLEDWRFDLLSFGSAGDPDPQTDLTTPLDVRILRQLQAAGVPLRTLGSQWEDRLRDVQLR